MSWGTWYCCFLCVVSLCSALATDGSCQTWHYYNNATGQCECGYGLVCSSDGNKVEIKNGLCVTSSEQEGDYYVGGCPFIHTINSTNRLLSEMPSNASDLDQVMCGPYNRRGLLCGECKDGFGPAVYSLSLKCANCSSLLSGYSISLYLFLQFIPLTLIFICFALFRINITSGPLLGYVLFCQFTTISLSNERLFIYDYTQSNVSSSLRVLLLLSMTVSQFWSLQFFKTVIPPFCISEKLTGIHVHMLNFIPAFYTFVLVTISFILVELHARNYRIVGIMWKPFSIILSKANITAVTGDAVFHAFASFLFLSNLSVLLTMVKMLDTTIVQNSIGLSEKNVFYVDPTMEWQNHKSIPYVLIAAVLSISFSVLPSVLLCIYPTRVYRYLSRFLSARKRLAITAFAEALHSCFKDGLNGTRDYRSFAGAIVLHVLLYNVMERLFAFITGYVVSEVGMWIILLCVISYVKPCKSAVANISLSFHLMLIEMLLHGVYLWEHDLFVRTHTLEVTIIAALLVSHLLVAVWAGYTLTKHTLTRIRFQFNSPGLKEALSDVANGVRHCLCRRHSGYQEMCVQ